MAHTGKEFTTEDGRTARVLGTGVLECYCRQCKEPFWVRSNKVWVCPCCGKNDITYQWTTPQVAFVPQDLTDPDKA